METLRFFANPSLLSGDLSIVLELLKKGFPVAIPTETVYGLAADLYREEAVQRVFQAKGRPSDNPLIAHVSSLKMAEELVEDLPDLFYKLAEAFWPGPLTLIAKRSSRVPAFAAAHLSTIAVRMPAHPVALSIIEAFGSPLAAPSANLSGRPSPTSAEDVLEDLQGLIPAVVDGGLCSHGIESSVIDLSDGKCILLRPGALSREILSRVAEIEETPQNAPVRSPGMKYRHYAPKAKVHLVKSASEVPGAYIPNVDARTLYAELRKADRLGYRDIAIVLDPKVLSDEALMNRLEKASN